VHHLFPLHSQQTTQSVASKEEVLDDVEEKSAEEPMEMLVKKDLPDSSIHTNRT